MNISVAKTSTHDRPPVLVGLIAHFDQSAEQIGHEIRFLHWVYNCKLSCKKICIPQFKHDRVFPAYVSFGAFAKLKHCVFPCWLDS